MEKYISISDEKLKRIFVVYLDNYHNEKYWKLAKNIFEDMQLMKLLFERILGRSSEYTVFPIPIKKSNISSLYIEFFKNEDITLNKDKFVEALQIIDCLKSILKKIKNIEDYDPSRKVYRNDHLDNYMDIQQYTIERYDIFLYEFIQYFCPSDGLDDELDVQHVKTIIKAYSDEVEFRDNYEVGI